MANPVSVEKFSSGLLVRMDDGSRFRAIETAGDMWIVGNVSDEPSPPAPGGTRFVWPAPLSAVTSEYGPRNGRLHAGIDFSTGPGGGAGNGDPMKASSAGKVYVAGTHGGYGNTVVLDHGQGLFTLYGHMQWGSLTVRVGDTVAQNQVLGRIGNTGNSFGAHIHFETHEGGYRWNASSVNPRVFFPRHNK